MKFITEIKILKNVIYSSNFAINQPTCSYFTTSSTSKPQAVKNSQQQQFDEIQNAKQQYGAKINRLSKKLIEMNAQRVEEASKVLQERRLFIQKLERRICTNKSRLILVGSFATGLATHEKSDLDVAFFMTQQMTRQKFMQEFWQKPQFKKSIMLSMANLIEQMGKVNGEFRLAEKPICVSHTHVPVIFCKFENGLAVDIQFPRENWQALRNTNMIKQYVSADIRLPQLFHWLKTMFTKMGVKNSREGLFSSYQILMLVIHFLQSPQIKKENVLPVLYQTHRNLFPNNIFEVVKLLEMPFRPLPNWNSACGESAGILALELVDYWAKFNPKKKEIHIGTGQTISRKYGSTIPRDLRYLQIYEPFDNVPITRSLKLSTLLSTSFVFIRTRLVEGKYIDDFPEFHGIGEDFKQFAQSLKATWVKQLNSNPESGPQMET